MQSAVPHLITALNGPFEMIESEVLENQTKIESWFRDQWRNIRAPFYSSVDLRNAGYKISPVDTNLFPGGFNNLNPAFDSLCIQAIQQAIEHIHECTDRILIVPENHTRNQFYLENLASIRDLIQKAGFEVRIGSISEEITEPTEFTTPSGKHLLLEPLQRQDDRAGLEDFKPCLIVLNNDMSAGLPDILKDVKNIITPPLTLGWSHRLKSVHFMHYQRVAQEFASLLNMDPWLFDPMFRNCGEVDFMKKEGLECLKTNTRALLEAIQTKYDEHGVENKPFVIIKADAGTYGMGVMTVHDADEVDELNRKQRSHMAKAKEGQKISKVIIQEGVYTNEKWGDKETVAEPVVYMIDHHVVGGFYRVNTSRGDNENLNSPGMRFEPLAFDDCCNSPDKTQAVDSHPNRFYLYGVVARLAMLAAAREIQAVV